MHLQYINKHLNLSEFRVGHFYLEPINQDFMLEVEPVPQVQPCPFCYSCQVIRNGKPYYRKARHLDSLGKKTFLHVPAI